MQSTLSVQEQPSRARESEAALVTFALSLLEAAATFAVVPVSRFHVGAVAIDDSGNFYFGANQEFAGVAMAQTIHAEQSAIVNAWRRGARKVAHIVVNHPPLRALPAIYERIERRGSVTGPSSPQPR